MEQFDQLLTCCICLDRYRTPKLLPCQHSYCLDPCMEGLVDYVKRQVKCPECRAEHRIPYNGIQGFPTNYTLTKFLELHAEITGRFLEIQYYMFCFPLPTTKRLFILTENQSIEGKWQRNSQSCIKMRLRLYGSGNEFVNTMHEI
jgi:Zinc finger, C3HC4 type (RING finger)